MSRVGMGEGSVLSAPARKVGSFPGTLLNALACGAN
jgi:hypothetical protein